MPGTARVRRTALILALAAGLGAAACEDIDCTPTTTVALDASLVMAPDAARSGILSATLTTGEDRALPGKKITFSVDEAIVGSPTLGNDVTDERGRARLDLKGRPLRLVKTVTEDEYTAAFAGDATYCPSADSATLDIARVG